MTSTPATTAALVRSRYAAVLADPRLSEAEKAGYLFAASEVDPNIPELSIEAAREIVRQGGE